MIDFTPFHAFAGTLRDGTIIRLRAMHAGDEAAFRELYAQMRAPELAPVPWPAEVKRQFCDAQYDAQDKHYRAHYAQFLPLAICAGETVMGRLYLGEFDGALILMDIIVSPAWRRRGIAGLLVHAVTHHADAGKSETRLHVEPHNPVRQFYERLGFVAVGEAGIYQQMVRRAAVAT